jgi:hypothetical protein
MRKCRHRRVGDTSSKSSRQSISGTSLPQASAQKSASSRLMRPFSRWLYLGRLSDSGSAGAFKCRNGHQRRGRSSCGVISCHCLSNVASAQSRWPAHPHKPNTIDRASRPPTKPTDTLEATAFRAILPPLSRDAVTRDYPSAPRDRTANCAPRRAKASCLQRD